MRTQELKTCPACGCAEATDFALGAAPLRRCTRCSLVHAPVFADPDEVFVDGYLKGASRFGFNAALPGFQEFLAFAAHRRLRIIERRRSVPATLLDVGCGSGELLAVARERGWIGCGVEPVEDSSKRARERGLDVRTGYLEDSGFPERSYDVVSAFHVLEHLQDAPGFLRRLGRWVRPGGYLAVEVPNWSSVSRWAWQDAWPHLRPLEHLAHYSPRTLASVLRRAGFDDVELWTVGFLWPKQSLHQMLDALAGHRWRRWERFADLLREKGSPRGSELSMASPAGAAILRGAEAVCDHLGLGSVVLALARAPGTVGSEGG